MSGTGELTSTKMHKYGDYMSDKTRLEDVKRFYEILGKLERRVGGRRILAKCSKYSGWPTRGVYFFMEHGEERSESGEGLRIVRIGTHSVKTGGSKTSLWDRLNRHKSVSSVFRRLIGSALINKHGINYAYYRWWSQKKSEQDPAMEKSIKRCVSKTIGKMPFLWIEVDVEGNMEAGAELRDYIEKNSIALLSNYRKRSIIDATSDRWLGHHATNKHGDLIFKVRESGLWSQNYVHRIYEPEFLDKLEELVEQMEVVR